MFKKPHHHIPGENFLTNTFLPAFKSQNREVDFLLRIEKLQRKLHQHEQEQEQEQQDSMANNFLPRPRERQVAIIQGRNGAFFWERKLLRQDARIAAHHPDGQRRNETSLQYLDRRVRELTIDGDTYRAEILQNRAELRRATEAIGDLKAELRRMGLGVGGGGGGGIGGGGGFGNGTDFTEDDGRPRHQVDDHGRDGAGRQFYEASPLDRRFPRG